MAGGISGRAKEKLTTKEIEAWIGAKGASIKLFDGGGLYLTRTAAGTAVWRVKYRFGPVRPGKNSNEKTISLGRFPKVGLKAAREKLAEVKDLLAQHKDPVTARRRDRVAAISAAGNTFAEVRDAWLENRRSGWAESQYDSVREGLLRYARSLENIPVSEISDAMVGALVEHVDKKGKLRPSPDSAKKLWRNLMGIFRYAIARGLCTHNPAENARELISRRRYTGRRPALLDWQPLGDILRRANTVQLSRAVHQAHRLCAFTAARVGNVIAAEWSEFAELDAEVPTWVIPRAKMKAQDRHHDFRVILGPAIAEELREWRRIAGSGRYLFPSPTDPDKHITSESLSKLYRVTLKLEKKHTPHGWRAALSTLANDNGTFDRAAVEMALDHVHDTKTVLAYDRGVRRAERIKLANWWCEQLVKAERGDS